MSQLRLAILVVCLVVPSVARAADGSVHLYLQPLPADAARLSFAVASVAAVSATGSEHPLTLSLEAVRWPAASRQRLLASGRLPAGSYTGFVLRVKQAALKGEQAESALVVPDAPVRLAVPFAVAGQEAPLFWLTLRYRESVPDGFAFSPVFSIAAPPNPIADHAGFVTNSGSNTITVFDKNLAQAVAAIDTCAGPSGMALDQRRRRAYVACSKDDEIQSIDVATGDIVERTRMSPGDRPRELVLTPDGGTLVSVNSGSNTVCFFDALRLVQQERVGVGSGPESAAIDPTGRRLFVFNRLSGSVSVVEVASRAPVATISTDSSPLRGQFTARGDRLLVIHERSPYMTVLDAAQLTTVGRARLRIGVSAIKVDTVRGLVCVGSANDTAVEFYDPNALMPLYSMRIPAGASFLTIDGEDNALYVLSPSTRSVVVGRLPNRKVASEIDVGDAPYWVAVMGER